MHDERPELDTATDPDAQLGDADEPGPEADDKGGQEDQKSAVDETSLTETEREFYKPGMSMAEVRAEVSKAFRAAKAREPGLTRADFEAMLDERFSALAEDDEDEEDNPEGYADLEARKAEVGREHAENDASIKAIETAFSDKSVKFNRLEGKIEETADPDKAAQLRHEHDRLGREIESDRREHARLRQEQRRLSGEYRDIQEKQKQLQATARSQKDQIRKQQAEAAAKERANLKIFNDAYDDFAKTSRIPEELRTRLYRYVQGASVIDLTQRRDNGETDLSALARSYGKELVGLFEAWKAVVDKRPKAVAAPGVSPAVVRPGPTSPKSAPKPKSRIEWEQEHEAVMAHARAHRPKALR